MPAVYVSLLEKCKKISNNNTNCLHLIVCSYISTVKMSVCSKVKILLLTNIYHNYYATIEKTMDDCTMYESMGKPALA